MGYISWWGIYIKVPHIYVLYFCHIFRVIYQCPISLLISIYIYIYIYIYISEWLLSVNWQQRFYVEIAAAN